MHRIWLHDVCHSSRRMRRTSHPSFLRKFANAQVRAKGSLFCSRTGRDRRDKEEAEYEELGTADASDAPAEDAAEGDIEVRG